MKVVPLGAAPHFAGTLPVCPANAETVIVYVKVQKQPEQNTSGASGRPQIAAGQGCTFVQPPGACIRLRCLMVVDGSTGDWMPARSYRAQPGKLCRTCWLCWLAVKEWCMPRLARWLHKQHCTGWQECLAPCGGSCLGRSWCHKSRRAGLLLLVEERQGQTMGYSPALCAPHSIAVTQLVTISNEQPKQQQWRGLISECDILAHL